MEIQKKTEKELKTEILAAYTKYLKEPLSDRRKVYLGQLEEWVYKWCRGYVFHEETEEIGVEFVMTVKRCAEKGKPPEVFLKYLGKSLGNARNEYYRNDIEGSLKETRIIKEFRKIIAKEESNIGRQLTQDECVNCLLRHIPMREKTIREHLKSMDRKFQPLNDKGNGNDDVDEEVDQFLTARETVSAPQDESKQDSIADIFMNVMEDVLHEAQGRTKECDRAIYTLYCIKKNINYQKIRPILDREILETRESGGRLPSQADIFLDYHRGIDMKTAESGASGRLAILKKSLKKAIQEKHPEINF